MDRRDGEECWTCHLCWGKDCLQKVGAFTWLAIRNRILTGEKRKRLGFMGPSKCVMCDHDEESVDHLLLHYEVASKYWEMVLPKLEWQGPFPKTLKELFIGRPSGRRKSILSCVWEIHTSTIIWEIWKERNRHFFQDKEESLERLLFRINHLLDQVNPDMNRPLEVSWKKSEESWHKINVDGASKGN